MVREGGLRHDSRAEETAKSACLARCCSGCFRRAFSLKASRCYEMDEMHMGGLFDWRNGPDCRADTTSSERGARAGQSGQAGHRIGGDGWL